MAALDFPTATTDGQIFKADNGVWYTWVAAGSYWSGSLGTAIGNLEGYYVNKTGDKMFGNLTLGTEGTTSIVLNATSGAATFDGRLTLNGTGAGTAAYIGNNGEVQITYDGTLTAAGTVFSKGRFDSSRTSGTFPVFQGRLNTTVTSEIKADGSITADGDVEVGGKNIVLYADGHAILKDNLNIRNLNGGLNSPTIPDADWVGLTVTDNLGVPNVSFYGDGSASFASTVTVTEGNFTTENGGVTANQLNSSYVVFQGKLSGTETSSIKADGSASFAGDVGAGNLLAGGVGTRINASGSIGVRRDDGTEFVFQSFQGGTAVSDRKISFTADGSATFAGDVGVGTSSPNEKLDVRGKIYLNNGTATIIDAASSGGLVVTNPTAVRFEVGSERMRIESSGTVRIGNTSVNTNASADELILGTTNGNRGITIFSGPGDAGAIYFGDTDTTGTGNRAGSIIYQHAGNYMRFSTNGNIERMRIDDLGRIVLPDASPGIQFGSASGSASSTALDDYEEGTWTPNIVSGGFSGLINLYSKYIKIGSQVTVWTYIQPQGLGNTDGFQLSGLPFMAGNNAYSPSIADIGMGGMKGAYARVEASSNQILFLFPSEEQNTTRYTLAGNNVGATNGAYVIFSMTYSVI